MNTPEPQKKQPSPAAQTVQKMLALTLCIALIVGIGAWIKNVVQPSTPGDEGVLPPTSDLLSAAPALPLTADTPLEGQREFTLDLSPMAEPDSLPALRLRDETLVFGPKEDRTVTFLLPFAASPAAVLSGDAVPALTVDGAPAAGELLAAPLPAVPESWQGWERLLPDTAALEALLLAAPDPALEQTVTVYTLSGLEQLADAGKDPAVGITVTAGENSRVFALDAASARPQPDGSVQLVRSLMKSPSGLPAFMVLGEPLEQVQCAAYSSSACNEADLLPGVAVTAQPVTAPLSEVLDGLLVQRLPEGQELHALAKALFVQTGLADAAGTGDVLLTDFFDQLLYGEQLFCLRFEVPMTAGGSVRICAERLLPGAEEDGGARFELASILGSSLKFYKYSAQLILPQGLTAAENNLNLPVEQGVFVSHPDPQMQHWSLLVRRS